MSVYGLRNRTFLKKWGPRANQRVTVQILHRVKSRRNESQEGLEVTGIGPWLCGGLLRYTLCAGTLLLRHTVDSAV